MKAQPTTARRIGLGVLAVCTAVLTSCAAGKYAQTANQTPAIDGLAKAKVGSVELRGIAVLTPPNGISYAAGDDACITGAIVNVGSTDDTLTGVSSPAAGGFTIVAETSSLGTGSSSSSSGSAPAAPSSSSGSASASGSSSAAGSASASGSSSASASASGSASGSAAGASSIAVPAGQSVGFSTPVADNALVLTGLTQKVYPGTNIEVTFTFQKAGAITVTVPVQLSDNGGSSTIPEETSTAPSVTS